MRPTPGKILALLIAVVRFTRNVVHTGSISMAHVKLAASLLLVLALIWFPADLGSVSGGVGKGGRINVATPPFLVSMAGWILLVGVPALLYFLA